MPTIAIVPDGSQFQLKGGNAYDSRPNLVATTTFSKVLLTISANSLMVTNDGTDFITVWLQGETGVAFYAYNDPKITYTGAGWNTTPLNGATYYRTSVTTEFAVFNPGISLTSLGFSLIYGTATGMVGFQLSNDGGATWKNPSTIAGVLRSDSATGAAMDTVNTAYNGTAYAVTTTFTLPNSAQWQLKVAPISATLYVGGASVGNKYGVIIKPGETQTYPIQTTTVGLQANSGLQPVRLVAIN